MFDRLKVLLNKMKEVFRKNKKVLLIFIFALIVRFIYLEDSVYFGYDEARDAYISQSIYKDFDIKLIGPPANYPGLNHGPLHWYVNGIFYLLGNGSPYFASVFYRILNASGVFLIYVVAKKLFDEKSATISSFLYAVSFEQSQYAIYMGNPSLAVLAVLVVFYGLTIFIKEKKYWGLYLTFAGWGIAFQLEFFLLYQVVIIALILLLNIKKVKNIAGKVWFVVALTVLLFSSTYILAEVKYGFSMIKSLLNLLSTGYNVMPDGTSRIELYFRMLSQLINYNVVNLPETYSYILLSILTILLFIFYRKNRNTLIVLLWIFSTAIIIPFGAYNAFYVNVGVGLGIIIGISYIISLLPERLNAFKYLFVVLIIISNLFLIFSRNKNSLIVEIKAQPGMKLSDEITLIDRIYEYAAGEQFTIRVTSMPYGIQTVWAYLFEYYGLEKYGNLPFWEGENVLGYSGHLPLTKVGTTCKRVLIREPVRGIPEGLIKKDETEENYFSEIVKEESIGLFKVQYRISKGECYK